MCLCDHSPGPSIWSILKTEQNRGSKTPFQSLDTTIEGCLTCCWFQVTFLILKPSISILRINQWFIGDFFRVRVLDLSWGSPHEKDCLRGFCSPEKNLTTTKQSLRRNIHHWLIRWSIGHCCTPMGPPIYNDPLIFSGAIRWGGGVCRRRVWMIGMDRIFRNDHCDAR